jgi:hypothetical protein
MAGSWLKSVSITTSVRPCARISPSRIEFASPLSCVRTTSRTVACASPGSLPAALRVDVVAPTHDFRGAVRAAVVDDQHFVGVARRRQFTADGVDQVADIVTFVVSRQHDGDIHRGRRRLRVQCLRSHKKALYVCGCKNRKYTLDWRESN